MFDLFEEIEQAIKDILMGFVESNLTTMLQIIFFCDHCNKLIAKYKCDNQPCNRNNHRFW